MNWQDYVEQRPDILGGKPIFRGTRIPVQMVLEELAVGSTEAQLLHSYPTLRADHFRAAYDYAAKLIANDESVFMVEAGA